MNKLLRRGALLLGGVVLLSLFLPTAGVVAHALLVRSLPAANALLTAPPTVIELWFSEELEPAFSEAYLVDLAGQEIARGAAIVDPADPRHMSLPTPVLAPGIYTVVYRTLSRADGHEWIGSFPLTVLNPDGSSPAGDARAPAVTTTAAGTFPTPWQALSRWLALMGSMLAFGAACFGWIGRKLEASAAYHFVLPTITQAIGRALIVGAVLLLLGSWLQLGLQRNALSTPTTVTTLLLQTRAGNLLLTRQLLAVGLLIATMVLAAPAAHRWRRPLVTFLSAALLVTFAVGSHAAGVVGSGWAIIADLIHLSAGAIWLGGLYLLVFLMWQLRQPGMSEVSALRYLIRRFSTVATVAVFVLAVTGLFSTLVQLHEVSLLWTSNYGQLLLAKVGLVSLMLLVALTNHRLARNPQFSTADWATDQHAVFRRQATWEAGLGIILMVLVAILVQTPIPRPATAVATPYFETLLNADDLTIHLQIAPNQVGPNSYTAHLYHADNSPIGAVQLVRLTLTHQSGELGQSTVELAAQGGDLFSASGAYQTRSGPWDLTVYVRRRGLDDLLVTTTMTTPVATTAVASDRQPWQNPIPALPPVTLIESSLFALVLAFLIWRYATQPPSHS